MFRPGYFSIHSPISYTRTYVISITSRENLVFNKTVGAYQTFSSGVFTFDSKCSDGSTGSISLGVTVPTLSIQQPKCYGSMFSLNITDLKCSVVEINNQEQMVTGPWILSSLVNNIFFCTNASNEQFCKFYIPFTPSINDMPEVDVLDGFCGQGGSLIVRTPNKYTSITLYVGETLSEPIETSTSGVFENLNQGTYTIKFESENCGIQLRTLSIKESYSPIQIIPNAGNKCPTNYKIELDIIGRNSSDFNWVINNEIVSNIQNITVDVTSSNSIGYTSKKLEGCSYNVNFQVPETILPISHSLKHTPCSSTVEIILSYPDYIKISSVSDVMSEKNIQLINGTNFSGTYGVLYSVEATDCFGYKPYYIQPYTSLPVLIEDEYKIGQCSCLYNTSFTVSNSYMFEEVILQGSENSFSMVNGRINLVPRSIYSLVFTQKKVNGQTCGITQTIFQEMYNYVYEKPNPSDLNFTISPTKNSVPNCDGESSEYQINIISPTESSELIKYISKSNGTFAFSSLRDSNCVVENIPYKIPPIYGKLFSIPTLVVIENSTCLYKSGQVNITTEREYEYYIDNIYIGILRVGTTSIFKNILPGNHQVDFYSMSNFECYQSINFTIYNEMPDFKFQAQVLESKTDCDGDTGTIKVLNYSSYDNIYYLGPNNFDKDGVITMNGNSSIYFNIGKCVDVQVWISELIQNLTAVIQPIIQPATCNSMSAQLSYSVTVNGKKYSPLFSINTSSDRYFQRGTQDVVISAGDCRFTDKPVIQYEDPKISYKVVPTTCQGRISYIQAISGNPNVQLDYIYSNTDNTFAVTDVSKLYYQLDSSRKSVDFTIGWNGNCSQTFNVEIENVNPINLEYDIIYPERCDMLNISIQVKNHELYSIVTVNNIQMDSTGRINSFIPSQPSFIYYLPITNGCDGEITFDNYIFNTSFPKDDIINDEYCAGTNNGQLVVNKKSRNQVSMFTSMSGDISLGYYKNLFGTNLNLPTNTPYLPQSSGVFPQLSSGYYTLIITDINNPFCSKRSDFIVNGFQPKLNIDSLEVCSANQSTPLNITFGNGRSLEYNLLVDGISRNLSTIGFNGGANHTIQVNITDSLCPRLLPSMTYQVPIAQPIDVKLTDMNCDYLIVKTPVLGLYRIDLVRIDSNKNLSVDFNNTNTSFEIYLDEGTYSVSIINKQSGCSSTAKIVKIKFCGDKKRNLGWIAGVVIGAILIALIVAFIIYKLKSKRFTSVKEINTPITMTTVPIFTGGKITQIDEF